MKRFLTAAAAALCVRAAGATINFDQGVDATAFLGGAGALSASMRSPAATPGGVYNSIALAKISVDEMQPGMNGTIIALLQPGLNVDSVLQDMANAGIKAQALSDGAGYYFLSVDASGVDAGALALGVAKFYYVTRVLVGQQVYDELFPPNEPRY